MDVSRDRIVELAATQGQELAHIPGASFAEVVRVPAEIQQSDGAQAAARVHGISDDEIACGTAFPESWARFLNFTEACSNNVIHVGDDTSDEEPSLPRPLDAPPNIVIAAHNGFRFDFAVLLFECERHKLPISPLRRWFFVDTLQVLESTKAELGGACLKLQCLINTLAEARALRAHRALDDCIALRYVVHNIASKLGCSVTDLLRLYAVRLDEQVSTAQVAALIEE